MRKLFFWKDHQDKLFMEVDGGAEPIQPGVFWYQKVVRSAPCELIAEIPRDLGNVPKETTERKNIIMEKLRNYSRPLIKFLFFIFIWLAFQILDP